MKRTRLHLILCSICLTACGADGDPIRPTVNTGIGINSNGTISTSTPDAVRTLLRDHPEVTTIVMTDVPGSADDIANLEAAGYTDCGDGIYEHPDRGRLTLRVGTTGGNALRELQQQLIQAQLAASGFEIVIDNVDGGAYFGERPFSEEALAAAASGGTEGDPTVWDITQFAWVGGPWPGGSAPKGITGNGNNPYGHTNADYDELAGQCDTIVDDAARADCYNELDRYTTTLEIADTGLFMIPLTQKPSYYGYLSSVLSGAGVAPDAQGAGPLANVVDFQFG